MAQKSKRTDDYNAPENIIGRIREDKNGTHANDEAGQCISGNQKSFAVCAEATKKLHELGKEALIWRHMTNFANIGDSSKVGANDPIPAQAYQLGQDIFAAIVSAKTTVDVTDYASRNPVRHSDNTMKPVSYIPVTPTAAWYNGYEQGKDFGRDPNFKSLIISNDSAIKVSSETFATSDKGSIYSQRPATTEELQRNLAAGFTFAAQELEIAGVNPGDDFAATLLSGASQANALRSPAARQ